MWRESDSQLLGRREILALGRFSILVGFLPLGPLCAAVDDFWNKKAPAEWTTEEIDRLLTKSPWAKETNAQYATGAGEPHGIPGIGNVGLGGRGRSRNGRGANNGQGGPSGYQGTVRWESAAPVLAALKAPLPGGFEGRYVISVNGFPATAGRSQTRTGEDTSPDSAQRSREDELENLKSLSSLQAKGRELVQAGVVQQQIATTGGSFLFGFSKELLPLDGDDKEVSFAAQLGNLVVKAKFLPKEMLYHGQLAL